MQRNSKPIAWRPEGTSDNIDSSQAFPGAMVALTNLVPDPATKGVWECRPAALSKVDFTGSAFSSGFSSGFGTPFPNAGYISVLRVFGSYVYGMIATSLNPGRDEPFVFNLVTNLFVPITGVTANNVPVSPATSGAWIPPQIDIIGSKVVVTHQGFSGAFGAFFGYWDVSTPTAPTWAGGNCQGANFPTFLVAPTGVAQYGDRAYFIHNLPSFPAVIFSDVLDPLHNSAGPVVPIITFGDNVPLTAIAGLPLSNVLGGIIQSLMVFKDTSNIYQITGDAALNTLTKNTLNVPTGTLSPRSVVPTSIGLAFISPDGLRFIDFQARVSDGIGGDGQGVAIPLMFSNVPSRIAGGANGAVVRYTTQNAHVSGTPFQEFWYDFALKSWSGPHTSICSCYSSYQNTFIVAMQGTLHELHQSDYQQSITSTFTENGVALSYVYATSFLPDTDQMTNNAMSMTTLDIALAAAAGTTIVTAANHNGVILDTITLVPTGTIPLWGQVSWGQFLWGGAQSALVARILPWAKNIDFVKLQIGATGNSAEGVKLGTLHMRYKILRFLTNIEAVV